MTILAITILWPRLQKKAKEKTFKDLIIKELDILEPEKECPKECEKWSDHLMKKFMHETIFSELSGNRDFILSIDQKLAYSGIQMWMHFHKAEKQTDADWINYHGDGWLYHLEKFIHGKSGGNRGQA